MIRAVLIQLYVRKLIAKLAVNYDVLCMKCVILDPPMEYISKKYDRSALPPCSALKVVFKPECHN